MGHTSRSMKDSGAESDLNCRGPVQETSEEKNIIIWPKDLSDDILVKNVATFCSCPKSLPETKLKNVGWCWRRIFQSILVLTV